MHPVHVLSKGRLATVGRPNRPALANNQDLPSPHTIRASRLNHQDHRLHVDRHRRSMLPRASGSDDSPSGTPARQRQGPTGLDVAGSRPTSPKAWNMMVQKLKEANVRDA